MAEKTSEKLFEFMKTITANEGTNNLSIKTELDLSSYKDSKEFKEGQKVAIIECKPISKKKTWQLLK